MTGGALLPFFFADCNSLFNKEMAPHCANGDHSSRATWLSEASGINRHQFIQEMLSGSFSPNVSQRYISTDY
jgi:hypothetical protein